MKKVCLLLMAIILCSLSGWSQSSVMLIGEACLRSSNIPHVKTMLLNEGLTINKSSELNNKTNLVFENQADNSYDKLFVVIDKYPGTQTLSEIKFLFPASGKYYNQWSNEYSQWGYKYDPNAKGGEYREVYTNRQEDYRGKYMGVNLNKKGWVELTFFRID